jgi:DNA processing protein
MRELVLAACLGAYGNWYNTKVSLLTSVYGSLENLYAAWKTRQPISDKVTAVLDSSWSLSALSSMEQQLKNFDGNIYHISDSAYPDMLRVIPDPPYVLYCHGDISCAVHRYNVACVGSRGMTSYGKRAIHHILGPLERYPVTVISGLALGIDGEVHRTALAYGLPTLAVLGGGLDRYEPVTNARLGQEIVAAGGAILSEYPPGTRPQKHHFLERNRIIAGLSQGVVVIEGKEHSGSLVTARYAASYGRDVGAVPGDIFSLNSGGPLLLLRDGATPVYSYEDILGMLGLETTAILKDNDATDPIILALRESPATIDVLQSRCSIPLSDLHIRITHLELQGRLECTATGEYYLKE